MAGVSERLKQLQGEIGSECEANGRLAKSWHFWLMFLTGLTIAASAVAGLLGLGFGVDTRIVGAVALIPGVAASILQQFKVPAKVDFHYRKWDALKALVRKVQYELPDNPKAEDVRKVSEAMSRLEAIMTADWQKVVGQSPEARQAAASR